MSDFLPDFIHHYHYVAVFLLMWVETIIPLFPSELVMPLSGLIASQGEMSLLGVTLSGAAGSMTGAISWYWAARALGYERFKRLVTRYGRITTVSLHEVDLAGDPAGARVADGLYPGARIVTAGIHSLKPGQHVRIEQDQQP